MRELYNRGDAFHDIAITLEMIDHFNMETTVMLCNYKIKENQCMTLLYNIESNLFSSL